MGRFRNWKLVARQVTAVYFGYDMESSDLEQEASQRCLDVFLMRRCEARHVVWFGAPMIMSRRLAQEDESADETRTNGRRGPGEGVQEKGRRCAGGAVRLLRI